MNFTDFNNMLNEKNVSFTNFCTLILLFLFSFKIINCQSGYFSLSDENCFNNVIKFENYLVNQFAQNNKGDFLIEFTENKEINEKTYSKKFYGVTKDGQVFFEDATYNYR